MMVVLTPNFRLAIRNYRNADLEGQVNNGKSRREDVEEDAIIMISVLAIQHPPKRIYRPYRLILPNAAARCLT